MELPEMVFSEVAAAVGAIVCWAVTSQGTGFRPSTIGVARMIVGAFGFATSEVDYALNKSSSGGLSRKFEFTAGRLDVAIADSRVVGHSAPVMATRELKTHSSMTKVSTERSTRHVYRRRSSRFDSRHHPHRLSREALKFC